MGPPPSHWRRRAWSRRALGLGLVALQTGLAVTYMLWLLPYHGSQPLEQVLTVLFGVLFAWISAGFWTALFGLYDRLRGGDPLRVVAWDGPEELAATSLDRTAVLVPIYHEEVARVAAGVEAIYRSLEATGQLDWFDLFILSDSRDPEVWLREQEALHGLRERLGAHQRIFYRRRRLNLKRKSGNVADFLRRWGGQYRYMVVLDADSVMDGETLVSMVRTLQRHPRVALLQTVPRVVDGQTLYARVQQFANRLYGPLFLRGLASQQLGEATFWGHNAIIRVRSFMKHCALARLPGRGPLSGDVLSHDFVEAALLGRAGEEVWLVPEWAGSYEETPPTLIDDLKRDRRWAEGNLQHLRILITPGFRLAHRLTFLKGVMSYVASPLWLLFLVFGAAHVVQLSDQVPNYFPEPHRLFPAWPEWRPEMAVTLLVSTLLLLFLPKLLSVALVMGDRESRRLFGGGARALAGAFLESLASALLAPIRMVSHAQSVLEVVLGFKVTWAGQRRDDGRTSWSEAGIYHSPAVVLGVGLAAAAGWADLAYLLWSLPVWLPLILAPAISVQMSRADLGAGLRRRGLLATPEETDTPPVLKAVQESPWLQDEGSHAGSAFAEAVVNPHLNTLHRSFARQRRRPPLTRAWLDELEDRCLQEGPQALNRTEKAALAEDAESLADLHRRVWQEGDATRWGLI